jgi:hypothetical protein
MQLEDKLNGFGRCNGPEASNRALSSADFITIMLAFRFSVHTVRVPSSSYGKVLNFGRSTLLRRSNRHCAASICAKCVYAHMPSAKTGLLNESPRSVNAYSTWGGLVGNIVRVAMPSRSNPLKVRVSICCEIASTMRLIVIIPLRHVRSPCLPLHHAATRLQQARSGVQSNVRSQVVTQSP